VSIPFWIVFACVVAQRLWELRVSAAHERQLRARGAREHGAGHYPWMVAMHAAWFVSWAAEVMWQGARPRPAGVVLALAALALGAEILRQWAIRTLGRRWTTRVLAVPGEPFTPRGPYRWLRHPNYAAVAIQLVALPLAFGAWRTAILGAVAYGAVLVPRLRAEAAARAEASGISEENGGKSGKPDAPQAVSFIGQPARERGPEQNRGGTRNEF
jgi:methyltransferase